VEYEMSGITQVQVDPKAQRTFASALRSILRQDPDVIMVGEIRDRETAELAVQAALTGHMVLSTLHTNTAIGTVSRLLDMGIERYLLAPALKAVVAQRLVRRLCPNCSQPYSPPPDIIKRFGLEGKEDKLNLKSPKGCPACNMKGFIGRLPIVEVLSWTKKLESLLVKGAGEDELLNAAKEEGFKTMLADGTLKALKGLTTLEEVWAASRV